MLISITKSHESVKQSVGHCLLRILKIAIENSFPDDEWHPVNLWYINLYLKISKVQL